MMDNILHIIILFIKIESMSIYNLNLTEKPNKKLFLRLFDVE